VLYDGSATLARVVLLGHLDFTAALQCNMDIHLPILYAYSHLHRFTRIVNLPIHITKVLALAVAHSHNLSWPYPSLDAKICCGCRKELRGLPPRAARMLQ
jgi:hypothetical protein